MRITCTGFEVQRSFPQAEYSAQSIVSAINQRESVFDKIAKVRREVIGLDGTPTTAQKLDSVLCFPEQYKSRLLRGTIQAAKFLEEMGEMVSDLSGSLERLCRNLISGGNKQDIPQIFSAGLGRVAVGCLNLPGFAVHKAVGGGLYFLSCLFSATALALSETQLGARRSPAEIESALSTSTFSNCVSKQSARFLTAKKEDLMKRLFWHCRTKQPAFTVAEQLAMRLSRTLSARGPATHQSRRFHTSYMWKHLHQYGPVTQTLMKAGQLVFHVVNKLGGSFDKYLGSFLGSKVFKPCTGRMLGHRLGMMICVSLALGLSFPMAPLIIGFSTASAMACGLAITLLLLAKVSAHHEGWLGNTARPSPA